MAALLSPSHQLGEYSANVTDAVAVPQYTVETLIGSQAEFEINKIRIPFLSDNTTRYIIKKTIQNLTDTET